jgi:hypothetical protein
MAISKAALRTCTCNYCSGDIPVEEEDRATYANSAEVNNPAGRFFSTVTATVHLCESCRGVVTVYALDKMLEAAIGAAVAQERAKYFGDK